MNWRKRFSVLLILMGFSFLSVLGQEVEWDFYNNSLKDKKNNKLIKINNTNALVKNEGSNFYLLSKDANELITVPYSISPNKSFILEFDFKGNSFSFLSYPKQSFLFKMDIKRITIRLPLFNKGKEKSYSFYIDLNQPSPFNYNYLNDGNIHNYQILVDEKRSQVLIYIDGQLYSKEVFQLDNYEKISFESNTGVKFSGQLYRVYSSGVIKNTIKPNQKLKKNSVYYNEMDFAPKETINTLEQLNNFPSPRLMKGYSYKRNFPWFDITYLSWTHQPANSRGSAIEQSKNAVDLMATLHDKWNYYFEIPVLRQDEASSSKSYSTNSTVPGALVNYARQHINIRTSGILVQIQNKPSHIGLKFNKNLEASNSLDDKYYMRDKNGKVILYNKKKVLSPIASIDYKYLDAKNSAYYLSNVERYLGRPIDFLNENGEISGHKLPFSLFQEDPNVAKFLKNDFQSDADKLNGYFQNKLDTAYKNHILRLLGWDHTLFSFYNVSAYNSNYWPDYSMRRTSNNVHNGMHYSTPSFYPASPSDWYTAVGSRNGLFNILEGRIKEITKGDKYFSPFISAGWDLDEKNILPSQWLSLNKVLILFGAEYFYTGYFNVTGTKGWPNGKGPNDPKGYLYQIVTPVYAQALLPYINKFILEGEFLGNEKDAFRIQASKPTHLVYAKKLKNQYVIVASNQRVANYKNIIKEVETTEIKLDDQTFILNLRPQGSVYILSKLGKEIKLKQIDNWHESTHPYWWSKNYRIEAELLNETFDGVNTENIKLSNQSIDLSNFRTTYTIKDLIHLPLYKKNIQKIEIMIKGKGEIEILGKRYVINQESFKVYKININHARIDSDTLIIKKLKGILHVDYFEY